MAMLQPSHVLAQLIPALLQPSPDLLKLSSNQCAGAGRGLQWSGNPYGNGYGVEMEWKWGTICENRMDWIGFGAECRLKPI